MEHVCDIVHYLTTIVVSTADFGPVDSNLNDEALIDRIIQNLQKGKQQGSSVQSGECQWREG